MRERNERSVVDAGFAEFYRRELPAITRLATSLSGSRERGQELTHEAFLRAYRDWGRVATLDRPGAWVRRVLLNMATDAHRRRGREVKALVRLRASAAIEEVAPASHAFFEAVRALPERQRAVVALRYVDDLALEQIAETLEMSLGTVKSTLFAGRRALARALRVEEGHDGDD